MIVQKCFAYRINRHPVILRHTSSLPFYGVPRPPAPHAPTRLGAAQQQSPPQLGSALWRARMTMHNAIKAVKDPTRADAVAAVGELTGSHALERVLLLMRNDVVGQKILRDRPLVTKETIPYGRLLERARKFKDTTDKNHVRTFGQAYGEFLLQHGFDPDDRDDVKFLERDSDIAYAMTRYRQCHDFWHALTGLPPTVSGELGLKWLELFQMGLPVAALSSTIGSIFTLHEQEQRDLVWNVYLPWARRQTMSPAALMNVYYEKEWDTPVGELRVRLGLEKAPSAK